MIARMAQARTDKQVESGDIICCLEFLAKEALDADLVIIHRIIKQSIAEIQNTDESSELAVMPRRLASVIVAFKFFARFCMLEDQEAREEILGMIESIDVKTWRAYAN
jgi:hypothetical protein